MHGRKHGVDVPIIIHQETQKASQVDGVMCSVYMRTIIEGNAIKLV